MISYKLTHRYAVNNETYDVLFMSKLEFEDIDRALANIQFVTDEVEHSATLEAIDHIQLLKQFYDNEIVILENFNREQYYDLDEYETWEFNCGNSKEIMLENLTINGQLRLIIKKILTNKKEWYKFYESKFGGVK